MCHALEQDPRFFTLLLQIDRELAALTQAGGCACAGRLHCADYPRKPRGVATEWRAGFERRFSFCCSVCRKRTTAESVRFLGRRVYLALVVVPSYGRACRVAASHSPRPLRGGAPRAAPGGRGCPAWSCPPPGAG